MMNMPVSATEQHSQIYSQEFQKTLHRLYSGITDVQDLDSIYRQSHLDFIQENKHFHTIYYTKLCSQLGLQKKAIDSLNRIKHHAIEGADELKAHYYSALASIAINSEEPEKSKQLHLKSLHYFQLCDDHQYIQAQYINLGRCYTVLQNTDSAWFFYDQASHLGNLSKKNTLYLNLNRALTASLSGKTEYAKTYFIKALGSFDDADIHAKVRTLGNIADLFFEQDSLKMAEHYYTRAREFAKAHHLKADLFRLNRSLSKLYEHKQNYELAYWHYTFSDSLRQSFNLSEVDKSLDKGTQFKKEGLNTQKPETSKNPYLRIFSGLFVILVIVYLLWLFRNRRKPDKKSPNPLIIDKKAQEIIAELETLIFQKELYKQRNLTIQGLAKKLKTNRTYLSEIINAHYKKGFSKWINEVRVAEAKKMLASRASQKYSIQGISSMVGFSSISAFNSNFKALTGLTPSNFRDRT